MRLKPYLIVCSFIFSCQFAFAQQGVNWLRCTGGSGEDRFDGLVMTRSGNLLAIGSSESNNGDVSGNHGTIDILLSALTPNGTLLWTKLIGGSDWDGVNGAAIDTLTDGHFALAFSSRSNDGDISGNHGSGTTDIVVRKYNPAGTLLWSRTLGGNMAEDLDQVKATPDGGMIIIGTTWSNNHGDVGANHGANTADMWVVKLNAAGTIQWQQCYGGSLGEQDASVYPAADGGYYFAVSTASADGDLAGMVPQGTITGASDIWFGKLNAAGNLVWSKQIGSNAADQLPTIRENKSSLYLVFQPMGDGRDVPQSFGIGDVAICKYSLSGNLIWKQVYGSFSSDHISAFGFHPNGSLYLAGNCWSTSFSGFPVFNPGDDQALFLKVDTLTGSLNGLRSIGGSARESFKDLVISPAGEMYTCGLTLSTNYGINGNHGSYDGLITRMAEGNLIQGTVYMDRNANNIFDPGIDRRMNYIPVESRKLGLVQGVSVSNDGSYSVEVDTGTYSTKPKIYQSAYYSSIPDSFTNTFTGNPQFYNNDIRIIAVPGIRDLRVYTAPTGPARPAFHTTYLLLGQNLGTDTVVSGSLSWKKDPRVTVNWFSTPPASITGDSMVWNFSSLRPLDSIRIFIDVSTPPPPALTAGDTLKYTARIFPTTADVTPIDNTLILYNLVVGPYDPNEKLNLQGNQLHIDDLRAGKEIDYIIHFQNLGTAPAFDVIVHDTISSKLQLSTLQTVAASHPFIAEIKGNTVIWKFININLPDSSSNEPGSHGFIAFRIKPAGNLQAGDSIVNRAGIYFDYNDAVVTDPNVVKIITTNIITSLPGDPPEEKELLLFPNPLQGNTLFIQFKNPDRRYKEWRLINLQGIPVMEGRLSAALQNTQLTLPDLLPAGMYILELLNGKKVIRRKLIIIR